MSRTYRRTQKGRKVTWLPNVYSYDTGSYYRKDLVEFRGFNLYPEDLEYFVKNPHRLADVDDYFEGHRNCCGCSWCLHEKKHRVLREIADAEIKAAYEGRESAFETLKPKKTKKYRKPFEVWKRTVYSGPPKEGDRSYRWGQTWYRIGRYRTREVAQQAMDREKRIWKAFEKEDYWYQFEIRESK